MRSIGGCSGASAAVALVALVITAPSTCSFVVVTRATSLLAVVVSGVAPKVKLSISNGTVLVRGFLLEGSSLVIVTRFHFGDG